VKKMKKMKKMKEKNTFLVSIVMVVVIVALLALILVNSGDSTEGSGGVGEGGNQATFIVTIDGEVHSTEDVTFGDEVSMFALMEEYLDATEIDGFVNSIVGVENNPDENLFWVYDINEEMGLESALDYIMQDGDLVEWKLESF